MHYSQSFSKLKMRSILFARYSSSSFFNYGHFHHPIYALDCRQIVNQICLYFPRSTAPSWANPLATRLKKFCFNNLRRCQKSTFKLTKSIVIEVNLAQCPPIWSWSRLLSLSATWKLRIHQILRQCRQHCIQNNYLSYCFIIKMILIPLGHFPIWHNL